MSKLKEKKQLAELRVVTREIRNDNLPLAPAPIPQTPEDMLAMFAGVMAEKSLKLSVAMRLALGGFQRDWKDIPDYVLEAFNEYIKETGQAFEKGKRRLTKMIEKHPLCDRLCKIKGFTPYQLGIIMKYVKYPERFKNPGNLQVYAGLAQVGPYALTKGNLNKIKAWSIENRGREFKGYSTDLQGRLLGVICDCLLRAKGFFYRQYSQIRERLETRAKNGGECEMIDGKLYMKGKNKQSLISWSDTNAKRRIARILLNLIYEEWMTLRGQETRDPYQYEYLNHAERVTLDEVIAAGG